MHDGDTVNLRDGRKVRLIGINTPELSIDDKPAEALATDARDALRGVINASGGRVGLVFGEQRKDRYGRVLAHLFSPDGGNLQAGLLDQGLAAALTIPPNDRFADCYRQAERAARCARTGLWALPAYAGKTATALKSGIDGFHVFTAEVRQVSRNTKGLQMTLSGGVLVGIHNADLTGFDTEHLLRLRGESIRVRGWLNPKAAGRQPRKGDIRFYMRLRHPAALEILTSDGGEKC